MTNHRRGIWEPRVIYNYGFARYVAISTAKELYKIADPSAQLVTPIEKAQSTQSKPMQKSNYPGAVERLNDKSQAERGRHLGANPW